MRLKICPASCEIRDSRRSGGGGAAQGSISEYFGSFASGKRGVPLASSYLGQGESFGAGKEGHAPDCRNKDRLRRHGRVSTSETETETERILLLTSDRQTDRQKFLLQTPLNFRGASQDCRFSNARHHRAFAVSRCCCLQKQMQNRFSCGLCRDSTLSNSKPNPKPWVHLIADH